MWAANPHTVLKPVRVKTKSRPFRKFDLFGPNSVSSSAGRTIRGLWVRTHGAPPPAPSEGARSASPLTNSDRIWGPAEWIARQITQAFPLG